jgi:hypothetical protein
LRPPPPWSEQLTAGARRDSSGAGVRMPHGDCPFAVHGRVCHVRNARKSLPPRPGARARCLLTARRRQGRRGVKAGQTRGSGGRLRASGPQPQARRRPEVLVAAPARPRTASAPARLRAAAYAPPPRRRAAAYAPPRSRARARSGAARALMRAGECCVLAGDLHAHDASAHYVAAAKARLRPRACRRGAARAACRDTGAIFARVHRGAGRARAAAGAGGARAGARGRDPLAKKDRAEPPASGPPPPRPRGDPSGARPRACPRAAGRRAERRRARARWSRRWGT